MFKGQSPVSSLPGEVPDQPGTAERKKEERRVVNESIAELREH